MFAWAHAVEVAKVHAQREGVSQAIAEAVYGDSPRRRERFVIGPARGWDPPVHRYVVRGRVRDKDLSLELQAGYQPPGADDPGE